MDGQVGVIRESLDILLEGAPRGIERRDVSRALCDVEGVIDIHDLHIWTVTSGMVALSCHCELEDGSESDKVLADLCDMLHERFGIHHVTIQPEVRLLHGGADAHALPRCTSEIGHEHRQQEPAMANRR